MNERYEQAVIERLSDRFGDVESTDLASVLMETAKTQLRTICRIICRSSNPVRRTVC